MSESDDTDVLLLIPPDFFAVQSTDSEDSDLSFRESYSEGVLELLDCERKVIDNLITHVNSLEDRLHIVENRSHDSVFTDLKHSSLLDQSLSLLASSCSGNVVLVNDNTSQNLLSCPMKSSIVTVPYTFSKSTENLHSSHYSQSVIGATSTPQKKPRSVPVTPSNKEYLRRSATLPGIPFAKDTSVVTYSPGGVRSAITVLPVRQDEIARKCTETVSRECEKKSAMSEESRDSINLSEGIAAMDRYAERSRNQHAPPKHVRSDDHYTRGISYRCGDDLSSVPDLNFGLRSFSALPVNEEVIRPKAVLPLGEMSNNSNYKHFDLLEVEALLLEMQKTQCDIENSMHQYSKEIDFNSPESTAKGDLNIDSKRMYGEGDNIGSIPDYQFGIRQFLSDPQVTHKPGACGDGKQPANEEVCVEKKISVLGHEQSVQTEGQQTNSTCSPARSEQHHKNSSYRRKLQFENDPHSYSDHDMKSSVDSERMQHLSLENFSSQPPIYPSSTSQRFPVVEHGLPKPKDTAVLVSGSFQGNPNPREMEISLQNQIKRIQEAANGNPSDKLQNRQQHMDVLNQEPSSSLEGRKDASAETPSKKKVDFYIEEEYLNTHNPQVQNLRGGGYERDSKSKSDVRPSSSSSGNVLSASSSAHLGLNSLPSLTDLWGSETKLNDSHVQDEVLKLRQKLEEERYRRQHCERLIQHLQYRLLEEQEKVAVAMRVDQRKDMAIAQLHEAWNNLAARWRDHEIQQRELIRKFHLDQQKVENEVTTYREFLLDPGVVFLPYKYLTLKYWIKDDKTKQVKSVPSGCHCQWNSNGRNIFLELAEFFLKLKQYDVELSKALDLAKAFKEKGDAVEEEKKILQGQHAKCIQELAEKLQAEAEKFSSSLHEKESLLQEKKELLLKIDSQEESLNKEQTLLRDAEGEIEKARKALGTCEAELFVLREERETLQAKLKDEKGKSSHLEQQKVSLQNTLEELRKREKTAVDEVKLLQGQLERAKVELRDYYQEQLEIAVREKLQEFQEQLDGVETAMQQDLENQEKAFHEMAKTQLYQLAEKHQLELKLLEDKHREELEKGQVQAEKAQTEVKNLQAKLELYQTQKNEVAKKLHHVMETQWQEALKIVCGNTSPVSAAQGNLEKMKKMRRNFQQNEERKTRTWPISEHEVAPGSSHPDRNEPTVSRDGDLQRRLYQMRPEERRREFDTSTMCSAVNLGDMPERPFQSEKDLAEKSWDISPISDSHKAEQRVQSDSTTDVSNKDDYRRSKAYPKSHGTKPEEAPIQKRRDYRVELKNYIQELLSRTPGELFESHEEDGSTKESSAKKEEDQLLQKLREKKEIREGNRKNIPKWRRVPELEPQCSSQCVKQYVPPTIPAYDASKVASSQINPRELRLGKPPWK